MRYDLRINNIFWREIEGRDIESALNAAGMQVDYSTERHELYYDRSDLQGIAKSANTINAEADDYMSDELFTEIMTAEALDVTYGPAY